MISENFCTGCGACFSACPQKAISMQRNRYGELEPQINTKLCNNCNLCKSTCPQNNHLDYHNPTKCYVAWSIDDDDCINSASAGIASVMSKYQLNNNAYIYGCKFDENINLKHFRLNTLLDIKKTRGSKYVQSVSYHTFADIKQQLDNNEHVLFISTPCQVAGLLKYLRKPYENLITVDLICHGTPPISYLKEHLCNIGINPPVSNVAFRGGEYDQMLTIYDNNKLIYCCDRYKDLYFAAFYNNIISMKSCYFCQYARNKRVSDITIGDFWGLKKLNKINKISNRPSIVLINTSKGSSFFEKNKTNLYYEERDLQEGISGNGRLNCAPGMSFEAKLFRFFYKYFGFTKSVKYVNRYVAYIKNFSLQKIKVFKRKIIK